MLLKKKMAWEQNDKGNVNRGIKHLHLGTSNKNLNSSLKWFQFTRLGRGSDLDQAQKTVVPEYSGLTQVLSLTAQTLTFLGY
jgi:hypothetical protein